MSDPLLRVLVKSNESFNVNVGASIWDSNNEAVGRIKEVHSDHIIGQLNNDEPTRFNFVGKTFDDEDDDKCQAIEPAAQAKKSAQLPDRLYIIEKGYTGGFSSKGFIWKEDHAAAVGKVKEAHSNYILGRLNGVDEIVRFDFVGERFKDVDEEPSQEIVQHDAQAEEQQAPAVGQYAFEGGKFFGKVTQGDNKHIRVDGHDGSISWNRIVEANKRFKFFTIEPGMWLAPKTSGVHRLIERIVRDYNGSPMVIMQDDGSMHFPAVIKYYDILTPEQHDEMGFTKPTVSVQPAAQAQTAVVYDEYGLNLDVGHDVFYKQTGEILGTVTELHPNNQITMEFKPGVTDDTVVDKPNTVECYNPRTGDQPWGFCPHNCDLAPSEKILRIDRLEADEKANPDPHGRTGCRGTKQKLSAAQLSYGLSEIAQTVLLKYLPVEKPAQVAKVCPKCNDNSRWQSSIRPEHGTDFCTACKIWWTSGDRSKPIVDSKDLEPSATKPARRKPFPTAAHKKLQEAGMNSVEAETWLSRNRPPVELNNGDTIVTVDGIYRLHNNAWVKVAGKLRVRCHKSTVDDSRQVVEYKFVSDALVKLEDRPKEFEDATRNEYEFLEWDDHMSDLRPKGKPLRSQEDS